ncbi:hypothetical protein Ddc_13630 [Ditylenchus destructor]|nr:hypothetical protein Ddc_13630 [Ditylenchus destructor]
MALTGSSLVAIIILFITCSRINAQTAIQRSELLREKIRELGELIVDLIQTEYNVTSINKHMFDVAFEPSVGVSVDPEGKALKNSSMVYVWTQNNTVSTFSSLHDMIVGSMGDPVSLAPHVDAQDAPNKHDSMPSRGTGGGRGSSAARSASASRSGSGGRFGSGAGTFASGIGGTRPHIWIFVGGGHGGHGYRYSDDREYDPEKDTNSTAVQLEISLCFGLHKSRQSCSAKVDALAEKISHDHYERIQTSVSWISIKEVAEYCLYFVLFMSILFILFIIVRLVQRRKLNTNQPPLPSPLHELRGPLVGQNNR